MAVIRQHHLVPQLGLLAALVTKGWTCEEGGGGSQQAGVSGPHKPMAGCRCNASAGGRGAGGWGGAGAKSLRCCRILAFVR